MAGGIESRRPDTVHDDARRFSTDAYPEALRRKAWAEVLDQALLITTPTDGDHLDGYVCARTSPLGSVFMTLSASAQHWAPHPANARRYGQAVVLLALEEGSALLQDGAELLALSQGDLLLLDPARPWRLQFATAFRAVIVKLEPASFLLRLVRGHGLEANRIVPKAGGVAGVCAALVKTVAAELERLAARDLLPLEATLTELLVACLSRSEVAPAMGGGAGDAWDGPGVEDPTAVQLGHLRRVCRTIEARLGDAELSLDEIGRIEHLSPRYLQKLFKGAGTRFGDYLKERRLERCRIDLSNPALAGCTIAELCYRWGFGDAANFSRAFAARYGASPKAWRAQASKPADAAAAITQRGRPRRTVGAVSQDGRMRGAAQGPSMPADATAARACAGEANAVSSGATRAGGAEAARRAPYLEVLGDHARYVQALALAPKRAVPGGAMPGGESAAGAHHYYLPVSDRTVHWGYLSRHLKPALAVRSGDVVTIETLTQHASDDPERMIDGDPGAESVFHWTAKRKNVERRGAGPMDASIYGRGAGEGFGVHICTGPVHVEGAEPGDVLEVRILDVRPRPSCHPRHHGRLFGSNAAAWWGYQYRDLLTEPRTREVVTVYEVETEGPAPCAKAVYSFRWTPQTDPDGVVHPTIDYPGVAVDPASVERRYGVLANARIPVRPHFGLLAVAPKESGPVDSIPPSYFGGNLDNWRAGKGAKLYLPVAVDGALFSVGDPHASQGDAEVCGTAIECSLTGVFQLVLHKRADCAGSFLGDLNYPFLEAPDAWVVQGLSHANHLAELGPDAQSRVYEQSSLDLAMRDAFRKTRRYLMQAHGLDEDEALSLMSVAVDFGVTQVVDGNWGVHAVISKALFPQGAGASVGDRSC